MIFQHTLDLVLSGRKSQTRRMMTNHDTVMLDEADEIKVVLHKGRTKWRVGQTYAIQPGRNKRQVARMKITKITNENVQHISTDDAIAEGYRSSEEFLCVWQTIHGNNSLDAQVWVISFELVGDIIATT